MMPGAFNTNHFKKWLQTNGAEMLPLTNAWEVVRARVRERVLVIYANKDGRISFPADDAAQEILKAFDNNKSMDLRPFDGPGQPRQIYYMPPEPSLRDEFAGRAMQAIIGVGGQRETDDHIAQRAYAVADAMLRARGAK